MSALRRSRAALAATASFAFLSLAVAGPAWALPDYDGDGVVGAADCDPLDGSIAPGKPDKPDLAFEDSNCDGIDGDESRAIFVAPAGNNANTGTVRQAPKQTIAAGIAAADAAIPKKDVYVAGGNYAETISLVDDVDLYGGYVPISGQRSLGQTTTITGSPQAVLADDDQRVTLQLLTLRGTPDASRSAYGLRALNNSTVALVKVVASGADATPGGNGASPSAPGKPAGADGEGGECPTPGTNFGLGAAGRNGGDGGAGGTRASDGGSAGTAGTGNPGSGGAAGGSAGADGDPGDPGSKPAKQPDGDQATFSLANAGATWTAPAATAGSAGQPGTGGGGGGGGGGITITVPSTFHFPGGGGGEGGGGGTGGTPGGLGQNGGGSFGVYLFNAKVVAVDSTLTAGKGGDAGNGGTGGTGGPGGDGGDITPTCPGGEGGVGGDGGDGGNAGHGGGGGGGPSMGVFATGIGAAYSSRATTETGGTAGQGGLRGGGGPRAAGGQSAGVAKAPTAPANATGDLDEDGITDANDACPADPRGAADANADGCPDRAARLADNDGDEIPNGSDACPDQARGTDANEDGCPDPPPAPTGGGGGGGAAFAQPDPTLIQVVIAFAVRRSTRSYTRFSRLQVKGVPVNSDLVAVCKAPLGKRCPAARFTKKRAFGTVSLRPWVLKKLPAGAKITVTVTKAGNFIGAVKVVTVRRRRVPSIGTRCLPPGATRPVGC